MIRPEKYHRAFRMNANAEGRITLIELPPGGEPERPVSLEDVSRCLLKPFLDEFGLRRPLVALEEI
jgi:hypothetical protein